MLLTSFVLKVNAQKMFFLNLNGWAHWIKTSTYNPFVWNPTNSNICIHAWIILTKYKIETKSKVQIRYTWFFKKCANIPLIWSPTINPKWKIFKLSSMKKWKHITMVKKMLSQMLLFISKLCNFQLSPSQYLKYFHKLYSK